MDRDQATYESYDGVRLELLNGAVAECEPLTVAEAVHFLRLLKDVRESTEGAHDAFVSEFPGRIGITDQRLVDLGLVLRAPNGDPADVGDLKYADAVKVCERCAVASWHGDELARSDAQLWVLEKLPAMLGVDGLTPPQVLSLAQTFAREFYLLIYGLAQDFCSHLTASPPVKVLTLRASKPMRGSTI